MSDDAEDGARYRRLRALWGGKYNLSQHGVTLGTAEPSIEYWHFDTFDSWFDDQLDKAEAKSAADAASSTAQPIMKEPRK